MYASLPPGATIIAPFSKSLACVSIKLYKLSFVKLNRDSGFLDHVPIPEHGASIKTKSNFFAIDFTCQDLFKSFLSIL